MWENSAKSKYIKNLMNNQNLLLGLSPPYGKTQRIEKIQTIYFDKYLKTNWHASFYIENIIYLDKIVRAL